MTFTHDDIQERLIDFLYGDLDGDVRAAFDAHLGACERCRLDVKAFEQTRAVARAVVRAPLDQPVPASVRARVMESAMRAAAERAAGDKATARPTVSRDGEATPRWLAWLRSRWTLPMLTTVAAMGALLLFRETIFREARRPLSDTAIDELLPKPEPAAPGDNEVPEDSLEGTRTGAEAAPNPSPEAAEPVAGHVSARKIADSPGSKDKPADHQAGKITTKASSSSSRRRSSAPAASAASAPSQKAKADSFGFGEGALGRSQDKAGVEDRLLGKIRAGKPAGPAEIKDEKPKSEKHSLDDLLEGDLNRSGASARSNDREESSAPAKSASAPAEAEIEPGQDRARFAQPPPPVARKPPAPAPAPTAAAGPAPVVAPPPPPAPRSPARAAKKNTESKESKKDTTTASEAPIVASEPTRDSAAPATGGAASRPGPDPVAVLVDRAEKLMTARRFAQAATAYRDLLQRFPQHASAPTWRRRLAAAQVAAAQDQSGAPGFATPPPPR